MTRPETPARPEPEMLRIAAPGGDSGLELALLHQAAARHAPARGVVLYVHGATFPSTLAVGFRFDGFSWMDDLAEAGVDVGGFDFLGYGASSRYPQMAAEPSANPPLGRAGAAAEQIAAVVREILARTERTRLHLIAHSWGTQPTALFAGQRPEQVDHLVLFGAVLRRTLAGLPRPESLPAWRVVTIEEQWARFIEDVPQDHPPVLLSRHFERWAPTYLATDSGAIERTPAAVQVPMGPVADIYASWSGALPYDPAAIRAPTLLVRGEWDSSCDDQDAHWLRSALRRGETLHDAKISKATHLMHLEENRFGLYRATREFLLG
jgi:pimeloyl-ACP methyl ester carboxylesterase